MTEDEKYQTAAVYRGQLAWLLAKAVRHFEGCKVEWRHVNIYKSEMDAIPMPEHCKHILEDAYKQLRAMVNFTPVQSGTGGNVNQG